MPSWNAVEGSLATPKGFRAAAAAAGIKKAPGALDLALIVCDVPGASAAGVFTTNRAAAAPVVLCRQNLKNNRGRRAPSSLTRETPMPARAAQDRRWPSRPERPLRTC